MKKAIVITLGVIIGVIGVLAICAHLADAARLALYVLIRPHSVFGQRSRRKRALSLRRHRSRTRRWAQLVASVWISGNAARSSGTPGIRADVRN